MGGHTGVWFLVISFVVLVRACELFSFWEFCCILFCFFFCFVLCFVFLLFFPCLLFLGVFVSP